MLIFPSPYVAPAGPAVTAVNFDGVNDYWLRSSALAGVPATAEYGASYLKYSAATAATTMRIVDSTSEKFRHRLESTGQLNWRLENSSNSAFAQWQTTRTDMADGTEYEVLCSWNVNTGPAFQIYVNGASETPDILDNGTGTWDTGGATDWSVGAFVTGGAPFEGTLSRATLWITDATGFADFDLTVAGNRTAMADETQSSSLGNGNENFIDMYGPASVWNAGTNQGVGGDGTMNGAVT